KKSNNPLSDSPIHIRKIRQEDIATGMKLKNLAGWNQTENDWRFYLDESPDGCFIAEYEGTTAGTLATISYGNIVAWIGMMLVDPEYRRKGIATRLMTHALNSLEKCQSIKLDATPDGVKVYERLGFREEYTLGRIIMHTMPSIEGTSHLVSPITNDDFEEVTKTDIAVFGANRSHVLKYLHKTGSVPSLKLINNNKIRGYCLGRKGTKYNQIGPVIAETSGDAIELTRIALQHLRGKAVVIDIPSYQQEYLQWLISLGFREERPLIRMYYRSNAHPGKSEKVYGITGPELG
ncbi:MAG: GNAT family N-acetyltransferase, partial [Candidatus Latescibacteria bacterium]|nr:GNAT family N-acetyltransferase [Candidatus Latescibacterota bacterium]